MGVFHKRVNYTVQRNRGWQRGQACQGAGASMNETCLEKEGGRMTTRTRVAIDYLGKVGGCAVYVQSVKEEKS